MLLCPYCNHEIESEKYYFCANCEKQIKCKICNELLMANKSRCLVCGTCLSEGEERQVLQNRYYFEENVTSESSFRKIE
jgi:DNA-directed RNA polymerase subunit M/transcription elongation factor TFIIS